MDLTLAKSSFRPIFVLIFLIFSFCRSEDAIKCSNKCSSEDVDLNCWQGTENFLLNQLVETVNNLAEVEFMIDKWRSDNSQTEPINTTVSDLVQRVEVLEMNHGPLDTTNLNNIVNYTVTQILNWAAWKLNNSSEQYVVNCPVPNDYVNTLWIYMFACACIVMVLTLIYVVIHVHKLKSGIRKQKRLL